MAKVNKPTFTEYNVDVFTFSRVFQQEGIVLTLSDKTKGRFALAETGLYYNGLMTLQTVYSAIASVAQNEAFFNGEMVRYSVTVVKPIPPTLVCELDEKKSIVKIYFSEHPSLQAQMLVRRIG